MRRIHKNISQEQLKAKNDYRDGIELLRSRVNMLSGEDRLLMTMYLEYGNSFRQMARLAGVNEANIARKIRKIAKRLINGEYITCLRNRDRFTKTEMAIVRDYFLLGLSIREIAANRCWSYYRVHKTLGKIQQFVTTIQQQSEDS